MLDTSLNYKTMFIQHVDRVQRRRNRIPELLKSYEQLGLRKLEGCLMKLLDR